MEWAKEIDAAIRKGLLDAKFRKDALALIRKDREAYDKFLKGHPGKTGAEPEDKGEGKEE